MKKIAVVTAIIVIVIIGSLFWWISSLMAPDPNNNTPTIFVINRGDGVREISFNLKDNGLIKNPIAFFLLIKQLRLDKEIQAGDFRLNPSMNSQEIAENLMHGRLDTWVTFQEGLRAEEIAKILEENIPTYNPSWKNELIQKEGYLFPDTYLIPTDADIDLVITTMTDNFEKKFGSLRNIQKKSLSKNDMVIIASMVEREVLYQEDRPLVAGVILNRLNIGMKLDIDATIQYALGFNQIQKSWWKKNLTFDDLEIDSLYNTYKKPGLPPRPIANPGLSALQSVLEPESTDYLYYVSDKDGRNHYAKTLSEHNENINKYLNNSLP